MGGTGHVVAEISPYAADLDWVELSSPSSWRRSSSSSAGRPPRCTASATRTPATPWSTSRHEDVGVGAVSDVDDFVKDLVEFAHTYAERARADHHLFVAAFRSDQIPGVTATTA